MVYCRFRYSSLIFDCAHCHVKVFVDHHGNNNDVYILFSSSDQPENGWSAILLLLSLNIFCNVAIYNTITTHFPNWSIIGTLLPLKVFNFDICALLEFCYTNWVHFCLVFVLHWHSYALNITQTTYMVYFMSVQATYFCKRTHVFVFACTHTVRYFWFNPQTY